MSSQALQQNAKLKQLEKIDITDIPPAPVQMPLELAEIKSTSDISAIQEPITFSRQELKKFKQYTNILKQLQDSDTARIAKKAEDNVKAKVAKAEEDRKFLHVKLKETYVGKGCLFLGTGFFLSMNNYFTDDATKDLLCTDPDRLVLKVLSDISKAIAEKIVKFEKRVVSTVFASKAVGSIVNVAGKAGNVVGQGNQVKGAILNKSKDAILDTTKSRGLQILLNILKTYSVVILLPVKLAISPYVSGLKTACTTLNQIKAFEALFGALDKIYMSICLMKTWAELATLLKNNAVAAGEKLAAAGRGIKSGFQALPGSAAATGQRIKSGFQALPGSAAATGQRIKSGFQALPGSAAATGQSIQSAFSGLGSRFGFKKRSRKNRRMGIVKRTRKNRR